MPDSTRAVAVRPSVEPFIVRRAAVLPEGPVPATDDRLARSVIVVLRLGQVAHGRRSRRRRSRARRPTSSHRWRPWSSARRRRLAPTSGRRWCRPRAPAPTGGEQLTGHARLKVFTMTDPAVHSTDLGVHDARSRC